MIIILLIERSIMSITEQEIEKMVLDEIFDFIKDIKYGIYDDEHRCFELRKINDDDLVYFHNRLKSIYDALDNYPLFISSLMSPDCHVSEDGKRISRVVKDIISFIDMIYAQYDMIKKEFIKF